MPADVATSGQTVFQGFALALTYWPSAIAKLGLTAERLKFIKSRETCAVQLTNSVKESGIWQPVLLYKSRQFEQNTAAA